jgi:general secretion pathway protein F
MIYKYRAKNGPQDIVEGNIEANSQREAVEKISALGYLPVQVEESAQARGGVAKSSAAKNRFRIRSSEITVFSRQLASLLKSGVPILASINIIAEQSEDKELKAMLGDIHNNIKEGSRFSSSLAENPNVFSPLFIAMIRAGEDSGSLPESLLRVSAYRAKQEEMLSRFRMAMAYPILMALVGLGTVIFMLTFVMPRLMKIFLSMGQDLPLPTKILISLSGYLRQGWIWVVLALVILVIRQQSNKSAGRRFLSVITLHIPIFGSFILKTELSRFSRTLELLIKSGIPILKAIDIATPVIGNEVIKKQLQISYKELEQGASFGRSLKNSGLFPLFMSNLIIVGEESGRLNDALSEVADSYERETDEAIRVLSSLLEPLMILGMGLVVGFIVVAMLLPVFQINVMAK